jgi:tetratricopeptide (TPR) repeat protein
VNQTAQYPLLKSSDAKKRYRAVKEIARAKDEAMLQVLAQLASSDPDEQVRQVAAKAQNYIASGLEAVPTTPPKPRPITKEDEQRAKEYMDEALSYQMRGEGNKALKALAKALQVNPNLERDSFFISVLGTATGTEGEAAMAMVRDKTHIKQVAINEKQLAREKRQQDHAKDTEQSTWPTALMDLAIFTGILVIGTILAVLAIGQSADGVITGYNASVDNYYLLLETDPKAAKFPDPVDPALWAQAEELRVIGLPTALLAGLLVGVSSVVSTFIQLVLTHGVARMVFKGMGTLPHLIYKTISFYNGKLPVLFVLILVGIILTFSGGGQTVATIFSGIVGLYSTFLSFKFIGRVTATYDFGMARGCLSVIIASAVVGVIGFIAQLVLLASVSSLLTSSFGA